MNIVKVTRRKIDDISNYKLLSKYVFNNLLILVR